MASLERIEEEVSSSLASRGWVLLQRNKLDVVYRHRANINQRLVFNKSAFLVYSQEVQVRHMETIDNLKSYLEDNSND